MYQLITNLRGHLYLTPRSHVARFSMAGFEAVRLLAVAEHRMEID